MSMRDTPIRSNSLGERDFLADQFFVMQNTLDPRDIEELQYVSDGLLRLQNELFVIDHQTSGWTDFLTLFIHQFNAFVPQTEILSIIRRTEASDGDFSSDDRMNDRPCIADDEKKLRTRKYRRGVGRVFQHERIFFAKNIRILTVVEEHFINKGTYGRIQNFLRHSTCHQSKEMKRRNMPDQNASLSPIPFDC